MNHVRRSFKSSSRRSGAFSPRLAAALALAIAALFAIAAAPALAAESLPEYKESITEAGGEALDQPWGMSFDSSGSLFLADPGADLVDKFGSSNVFAEPIGAADFHEKFNRSVAVNDATGDLYVGESGSEEVFVYEPVLGGYTRVQHFNPPGPGFIYLAADNSTAKPHSGDVYVETVLDSTHQFVYAYNTNLAGEIETGSAEALTPPPGGFRFETSARPNGLTVDASTGELYIAEPENHAVSEYSSAGVFQEKFEGTETPAKGFKPGGVAVDEATGRLYVLDESHHVIDIFDSANEYEGQLTGNGKAGTEAFSATELRGVAVQRSGPDAGAVYVSDRHEVDVFALPPASSLQVVKSGTGTGTLTSLAPHPGIDCGSECQHEFEAGDEVELSAAADPGSRFVEWTGACSGSGACKVTIGVAIVQVGARFDLLPEHGPELLATYATEVSSTGATLGSLIDPEAATASYGFEYLTEAEYEANLAEGPDGFAGAHPPTVAPVPDAALGTGATGTGDLGSPSGSPLGEVSNLATSTGAFAVGQLIEGAGIPARTMISAVEGQTLLLSQRPTKKATGVALTATPPAALHIGALAPSTAYVYRVHASNGVPVAGPPRSFTTQGPAGPLALLDQRAWEMVSPLEKGGGGVAGIDQGPTLTLIQAAADGEAITYGSPVAFADPTGAPPGNQYLSTRHGQAGWSTQNIGVPSNSETNVPIYDPPYKAFSADLSTGLLSYNSRGGEEKYPIPAPPLPGTEGAPGFGNFYLRDSAGPSYRAILTEAQAGVEANLPLAYEDATPDLRHVVFSEAEGEDGLYEWAEGSFYQINFLPGETNPTETSEGLGNGENNNVVAGVGRGLYDPRALSANGSRAVWAAGNTAPFSPGHNLYLRENIGRPQSAFDGAGECTEPQDACTLQIDASEGGEAEGGSGAYLASSTDDSVVYFADHRRLTADSTADQIEHERPQLGDLYLFEAGKPVGERLTDLTTGATNPGGAEVLGALGASADGSYLYFAANGVLASNQGANGSHASPGDCEKDAMAPGATCNLYFYHEGALTFIGALAGEDNEIESDVTSLGSTEGTGPWLNVAFRNARVSPDGDLLFTSSARPTGYDNTAANGSHCGANQSGEPLLPACPEVYRYAAPDAANPAGSLACLSCNPTGERPLGLSALPTGTHTINRDQEGIYASRAFSADGRRAFFDSYDALVPQDTNGRLDVYQWEEAGEGTCAPSGPSYEPASGGCLSLISSGTGSENSDFMDASADGSDVFFRTGSSLVPSDPGSVDLYDARVGGGIPAGPPPPASCQGDACQSPPPAPNDPTPASSTFEGAGNVVEPKPKCKKGKVRRHGKCVRKHRKAKHKRHHRRANHNRRATR